MTASQNGLPQNTDAEMAFLGSLIIDPVHIAEQRKHIAKSDFYLSKHGVIYEAMLSLFDRGAAVDLVTVAEELRRRDKTDPVAGEAYLIELANRVPTSVNVSRYCDIVREAALRRRAIRLGGRIATAGYDESISLGDMIAGVEIVLTEMRASANGSWNGAPALSAISGEDLMAIEFPILTFLIDGMLAKGYFAVLGGRPKSGKSWLCLQAAMAIDTGSDFLGRSTRRGKVLYVALEDGERRIQQRMKILKWQPRDVSFLFSIGRFDEDGQLGPGLWQIEAMAKDFDLIIVDTLVATLSGRANENDNTQMGAIVNHLARVAHESDTGIMAIHHTGKNSTADAFDMLRGASAIRGAYDVGMVLERKQEEREALLHMEARDFEMTAMTIRQSDSGAGWDALGSGGELQKIRAGRRVVEAMMENGDGLTAEELGELMNVTRRAAHSQLTNAEKYGYVRREPADEPDTTKQADLWFLTDFLQ